VNSNIREVFEAGRDVLRITFIEPVATGRPKPGQWPFGLRPVGWAAAAIFALLVVATLAAEPLRHNDVLVASTVSGQTLPALTIPILLTAVVLSFSMALTAALHAPWWLRIGLMIIGAMAALSFTVMVVTTPAQQLVAVTGLLGVLVFILIRAFRSYAWWEFPVMMALLTWALLVPWGLPSAASFGVDLRPIALEGGFSSLMVLTLPAIMVAGFAPAQVVVTGAQAIANRPVSRGLFWTVFAIAIIGLAVTTVVLFLGDNAPTAMSLLVSLGRLMLTAGVVALLLRRARASRPPDPAAMPEAWSGWVYPIAAGVTGSVLLSYVAIMFVVVLQTAPAGPVVDPLLWFFRLFYENDANAAWRALMAIVVFVAAWKFAGRRRLTEAIMLGAFGVTALASTIPAIPSMEVLLKGSVETMGLIAVTVALVATVVHLTRRRFDRGRATGVLTVVFLNLLYPHRDILSDPLTTALTLAPAAMLVFGLAWRVMTEAQVTYESSPRYPQSTRVLLFMANSLLATTGVALVALSRATGTLIDNSMWAGLGDTLLGEPLYVAGLVTGLWLMLRPRGAGEVSEQLTDERYDSEEVAAEEAAEAAAAAEMAPGWSPNIAPPDPPQMWPPPPPGKNG